MVVEGEKEEGEKEYEMMKKMKEEDEEREEEEGTMDWTPLCCPQRRATTRSR